jgi:SpoVK/Ycf46/Vps4 family AAA+-type ATPase
MFARAAASEMKRLYGSATEFISISGAELQSMYIGETEGRIKAIFAFAHEYQAFHGHPLLVFMDEAEVLLPDRTGRVRRVAPWEESQVATFLAEMDGMQESGAFVLLATNRPNVIDQAVLRDGRCDFKIVVQRPTPEAIESILRKNFAGVLLDSESKLEQLVFAAVECLHDPQKIIIDAQTIKVDFQAEMIERGHKHFLLEHIVSGAMAASIPGRAKRAVFTRDKADGVARGVTTSDVVKAVNDIFEENRGLDHAFAFEAFMREFLTEATASRQDGKS